jgi:hypothetical protein
VADTDGDEASRGGAGRDGGQDHRPLGSAERRRAAGRGRPRAARLQRRVLDVAGSADAGLSRL